jgi:hypothetical protein
MALSFAAFYRLNRLAKHTLVCLRPERIRVFRHDLKRKAAANHRLSQKQADGTGHVESGESEQLIRLLPKGGIDTNL